MKLTKVVRLRKRDWRGVAPELKMRLFAKATCPPTLSIVPLEFAIYIIYQTHPLMNLYTVVMRTIVLAYIHHSVHKMLSSLPGTNLIFLPCPLLLLLLLLPFPLPNTPIPPPENSPKHQNHKLNPKNHHPRPPRNRHLLLPSFPLLTYVQKLLRIIRNHSVHALAYTPPHHILFIHRPTHYRSPPCFRISHESRTEYGCHEGFLENVEGDIGDGEELACVGDGESDVRYRVCG